MPVFAKDGAEDKIATNIRLPLNPEFESFPELLRPNLSLRKKRFKLGVRGFLALRAFYFVLRKRRQLHIWNQK